MNREYYENYCQIFQSRDYSWLKFNERVLEEALDRKVPFFEKLNFIDIFNRNLDEFFMVRVGRLINKNFKKPNYKNKISKLKPKEELNIILKYVSRLYIKKTRILKNLENIFRRKFFIYNLEINELRKNEKNFIKNYYLKNIKPSININILNLKNIVSSFKNCKIYIILKLKNQQGKIFFATITLNNNLPDAIIFRGKNFFRYILIENVIYKNIKKSKKIFGFEICEKAIVRVTKNSDINFNSIFFDFDRDFIKYMKKIIKLRKNLPAVRLEYYKNISKDILYFLKNCLLLKKCQIFKSNFALTTKYINYIRNRIFNRLKNKVFYKQFFPLQPSYIVQNKKILHAIFKKDILLFYPYESMDFFIKFLYEAAVNKNVISIYITIYRLAKNSRIVDCLKLAKYNKKNVVVVIELRARFDEENNIKYAALLKQAGCKVLYGFKKYKIHSKICLITFNINGKKRYITQIGTGNYNEKTATIYSDLSFFTANYNIGKDGEKFFKDIINGRLSYNYKKILVAPIFLKQKILYLIDSEAKKGKNGRIFMKVNALTDIDIINRLIFASKKGVDVVLNVRGACCFNPLASYETKNIKIFSIVGRFLEHFRIYCFGKGLNDIKIYISSADIMVRNMKKRVEIAVPIENNIIKNNILNIIKIIEKDNKKARIIGKYGKFKKCNINKNEKIFDYQEYFIKLTEKKMRR